MTEDAKKKIVTTNAALWTVGILLSFVLPMIGDSITEGRGNFLRAMLHVGPLFAVLWISTVFLGKGLSAAE